MKSKMLGQVRKGALSHLPRSKREELSYIWMRSSALEDAYIRYAERVGDIVTEDGELILVTYTLQAIDAFVDAEAGFKDSSRLYMSKLVDGMEAMTRYNVVCGKAPFENIFDIYSDTFVNWYKKNNCEEAELRIKKAAYSDKELANRETARLILLSKIACSHNLMMMGVIPKREMEVN